MNHLCRIDDSIKHVFGYEAQFECGLLERKVVIQGVVRNLGGFVVTNNGRKRRYQHEGSINIRFDLFQVRLCAFDQELPEVRAAVRHDRDRMSDVKDDERLVDVHLESTGGTSETHCYVLGHHCHRTQC